MPDIFDRVADEQPVGDVFDRVAEKPRRQRTEAELLGLTPAEVAARGPVGDISQSPAARGLRALFSAPGIAYDAVANLFTPPEMGEVDESPEVQEMHRRFRAQREPVEQGAPLLGPETRMDLAPAPPPGRLERAGAVFSKIPEVARRLGYRAPAPEEMRILAPEEFMTPAEQLKHPMTAAVGEFAGGLTSPENVAIIAGTGGLGAAPGVAGRLLPRLVSGYFSYEMLKGAYEQVPEFKAAIDRGDEAEAKRIITHITLGGGMGALAGQHGFAGKAPIRAETPAEVPVRPAERPAVAPPAPEALPPPPRVAEAPQARPKPTKRAPAPPTEVVPPAPELPTRTELRETTREEQVSALEAETAELQRRRPQARTPEDRQQVEQRIEENRAMLEDLRVASKPMPEKPPLELSEANRQQAMQEMAERFEQLREREQAARTTIKAEHPTAARLLEEQRPEPPPVLGRGLEAPRLATTTERAAPAYPEPKIGDTVYVNSETKLAGFTPDEPILRATYKGEASEVGFPDRYWLQVFDEAGRPAGSRAVVRHEFGISPTERPLLEGVGQGPLPPAARAQPSILRAPRGPEKLAAAAEVLPGMERAVAEQRQAAAELTGERLTGEMARPLEEGAGKQIEGSPLFRGTEAAPQQEMFGAQPSAPPLPVVRGPGLRPEVRDNLIRSLQEDLSDLSKQAREAKTAEQRADVIQRIAESRKKLKELQPETEGAPVEPGGKLLNEEWLKTVKSLKGVRESLARDIVYRKKATDPLTRTEYDMIESIGDGLDLGKVKLRDSDPLRRWPMRDAKALNSLIQRGILRVVEKVDGRRWIEVDRAAYDRAWGEMIVKESKQGVGRIRPREFGKTDIGYYSDLAEESGFRGERGVLRLGVGEQLDVATPRLKQVEAAREAVPSAASRMLETVKEVPTNFVRKVVSQFVDVEKMVKDAERRGVKVRAEENPAIINDLVYGGTGGRVELAAMNYRAVVEEATKKGLRRALNNYLDLRGYDRALRIIEERIREAEKKEGQALPGMPTEGVAQELRGRLERKEVVPAEYTRETIAADLKAIEAKLGPKDFAEVKRMAEQVNNLNREAWDLAYKEGIISEAVYRQGIRRGNDYIPLERIMDEVVSDSQARIRQTLSLAQQQILKRLEGSKRVNVDPVQASLERHAEIIREAGRNEAARTLIDFRKVDPDVFGKEVFEVKGGQKVPKEMGTVSYYEAGKRRTFAMPDIYANAMNLANAKELSFSKNILLRMARSGFRVGATTGNLAFGLPNVIRDISEMAVLSKAGVSRPLDTILILGEWSKSLYGVVSKSDRYKEFLRSRAAFSTLQKNIDPAPFVSVGVEPLRGLQRLNPMRIIHGVEGFNNALEEATKLTTLKRAKGMGMGEVEAAFETRRYGGSPDFARRGTMSPDINLMVMFFNAQVQGITRMARILGQSKRLAGFLSTMTAAELALYSWNQQFRDEEGNLELDRVPRWERDTHWVIIRPETYQAAAGRTRHRVFKIRKGDIMQVVSNPLSRAIETATGGQVDLPQTLLDTVAGLTPGQPQLKRGEIGRSIGRSVISSLNPLLRAPLEQLANREMFRDVPIVPRSLEEAIPEEQRRETTSPVAVGIGRSIGVSPLRVEHVIRSFFVGLGEQGLNIADTVYGEERSRLPLEGDEELARTKVLGPVIRRFVGSAMDQREKDLEERFYKRYDQARETVRTFNLLAKSDEARAEEFVEDPERLVLYHTNGVIQTAVRDLADIRDLQREVARSDMTDAEKKEAMRFLHEQRMELLRVVDLVDELVAEEKGNVPRRPGRIDFRPEQGDIFDQISP